MENIILRHKIGKSFLIFTLLLGLAGPTYAENVQFTAMVDRNQIGLDESVSLKFSVQGEGNVATNPPTYDAPDFQEVNSYDSSFVESTYDSSSGQIVMKTTQMLTKVLRPLHTGQLKISHISTVVNGKSKSVPDILVQVNPGGSGTPPPSHYGGSGLGLRGATKRTVPSNTVFIRAELDKDKIYKGEQVIVSYYFYRRVRVLNIQVDKFPVLNGFLREELEMPVMQPRLEVEAVVLDGVPYQRSLLARYAAYPLQEGKLDIDTMNLKYTYYAGSTDDGEDPFMQFFKQLTPREGLAKSDPISVNVLPIPADGRPASFSGGVGDFTVTSAADKTEVRANEAITLKVKIEGRGNLAAIGEPKAHWPPNVELYDSKGSAKASKAGVGEKDFEILLIPRVPGDIVLPAMEFSFFDPNKKTYVTRTTDPIKVHVNEAAPGSAIQGRSNLATGAALGTPPGSPQTSGADAGALTLRDIKPPSISFERTVDGMPIWRALYILVILGLGGFALWVASDFLKGYLGRHRETSAARARADEKSWKRLRADIREAKSLPWKDVLGIYDRLCSNVLDAIDQNYNIGARSLPRVEIGRTLVQDKNLDKLKWEPINLLLEYNEMIRFAGAASASMENQARQALADWVTRAESAVIALTAAAKEKINEKVSETDV